MNASFEKLVAKRRRLLQKLEALTLLGVRPETPDPYVFH